MPDVRQIHRLQETDLGIEAREAELAEVTASLSDESEITGQQSRSRKLESELEDLATARRALERALEEIQQGLQKVEGRLYGGTVTNPKELEGGRGRTPVSGRTPRRARRQASRPHGRHRVARRV